MMLRIFRSWHNISSVHLIHKKDPPVIYHKFSERGLVLNPKSGELPIQQSMSVTFTDPEASEVIPHIPSTYFPENKKEERPTVRNKRKNMRTSIKKTVGLLKKIRKLHAEDAIFAMKQSIKKPAFWIQKIIENAVRNGVLTKGMYKERLYIKEAFVGRNTPLHWIRYHGRGRGYETTRPRSEITVVLEEKTPQDIYKILMTGNYSPALASFLRNNLLEQDASYKDILKYQNMLSAKGRHQQRIMLKRRIARKQSELRNEGLVISKERVETMILDEESEQFAQTYWDKKKHESERRLTERLEIYKKNQGIK